MKNFFLIFGALIIFSLLHVSSSSESVSFLDVGQGDAILLQDGSQQVLIDGGPGSDVLAELADTMPLFDRTIEVVVVSHPQQDHIEGLLHVFRRYNVGLVLLPRFPHDSGLQKDLLTQIREQGIPYRFVWAGQQLQVGDIRMTMLGPIDSDRTWVAVRQDINNASSMMRVDYHDLSFLLTGDAEIPIEHELVERTPPALLDIDILKAGHHGSKTSTTSALVSAASPAAAVISVGADNKFGHPHDLVLQRLRDIAVLRTDEQGRIEFMFDGNHWRLARTR